MTPEQMELLAERRIPVAPTMLIGDRMRQLGTVSAETIAKSLEVNGDPVERFRQAGAAGVRFVLGTDANGVFTRFGDQMEELRLMMRSFGWTAERALQAGTSDAADAIGLGDRLGRVRPGSAADFVVMRGTPWRDIDELDTANIVAVVARGLVVSGALPA
jgi:imidazolonepropionase-like amidohydrolase